MTDTIIERLKRGSPIFKTLAFKAEGEAGEFDPHGFTAKLTQFGKRDAYGDIIDAGALDAWLSKNDSLVMFREHQDVDLVGEWGGFAKDGDFLTAKGNIFTDTSLGGDWAKHVAAQRVTGVSIGFIARGKGSYSLIDKDADGIESAAFQFHKIELVEASLTRRPAMKTARVSYKSAREALGLSKSETVGDGQLFIDHLKRA